MILEIREKGPGEEIFIPPHPLSENDQGQWVTVLRLTPSEADRLVKEINPDYRFDHAVTHFVRESWENSRIILDATLSEKVQEAYLYHEAAQLRSIINHCRRGGQFSMICRNAHDTGTRAGLERAKEIGALEEYLVVRQPTEDWFFNQLASKLLEET